MFNFGNGNEEFTLVDLLGILSFLLGIANYNENVSQSDVQDLMKVAITGLSAATNEVHSHLKSQDIKLKEIDDKLNSIINRLEAIENEIQSKARGN